MADFRRKRSEAGTRHKRAYADSDPNHLAPVIAAAGELQSTKTTEVKLAAASASISLTDCQSSSPAAG